MGIETLKITFINAGSSVIILFVLGYNLSFYEFALKNDYFSTEKLEAQIPNASIKRKLPPCCCL